MGRLFAWPRDRSALRPERMDELSVDPDALRRSLAYIRRVNSLLGYHRATIGHLRRFSRGWERGRPVRVVDVATGSADLPRAVLRWAARGGFDVRVVSVDRHPATLREAAALTPPGLSARLTFARADALSLPFADGSFDYALASMFLHHLDDTAAAAAVREMARVARRGIVVADLLRHRRAYAWITLFTLGSGAMVKHDARASVAQAFTKREVLSLRERAEVGFAKYYRHFGHRFILAGQKPDQSPPAES
jgi:ubiquinone/menaquinone biosynthesis C-methylase UbiE